MGGITKPTQLIHVHMGGLDKIVWFACFNDVLKQCGLGLTIIYINTRVLEFWVMETTNILTFCTFYPN
jgi:hypothetical protein